MKILIACEESQAVCKAFRLAGHEAFSCDILPCSGGHPEWHIQGDVIWRLSDGWDMLIAHPPCTFLCNSGVRWLKGNPQRFEKMLAASEFFKTFLRMVSIPKICVENPIPHKHAKLPPYTQIIHPWQFGHGEKKRTCLWLRGLPELTASNIVEGREQRIWRKFGGKTPDRSVLRSKTFPGIASAMAAQWG